MFELFNDMLELIYVADFETYDLLFLNTAGREKFHVDDLKGVKCYKALQNLDAPCSFCTNHLLTEKNVYSWEFTNSITKRHYLLKDRLIDWDGKKARMEIAFDATENENEKTALKNSIDAERMVMECVKQLYQTVDINETINDVLRRVGTFLSADRVYIFGFHDKEMFNRFEWCADGITPQIKNLQHLNIALIDSWMPFFCQHECKIISDLETIKESEPISYEILSNQNIHSLVAAPLEKDGHLNGYFGVDNPPEEKIHNIISLFHTLSFFLMASMRRAEDEQLLAKLSYYDVLTGFYNRNRFIGDTNAMTNLNGPIGVVYLDVNGLKDINDLKGHDYGDRVLISCAKKMEEEFANGSFYRIGGDEFVIICKQFKKEDFLNGIKRLKARFADDNDCRAAIGYQWEESVRDVGAMIIKADAQMYEDKKEFYRLHPSSHRYREWNKE